MIELYGRGIYPSYGREIKSKLVEEFTDHGKFGNDNCAEDRTVEIVKKYSKSQPELLSKLFTIGIDDYTIEEFCNWTYKYNNYDFRSKHNYTDKNTKNEIWCFGCSYTEGIGVPESRRWTSILQNFTDQKIINYGLSGTGINTAYRIFLNWVKFVEHPPSHIIMLGFFEGRAEQKRTFEGNTFYRPLMLTILDDLKNRNKNMGVERFKEMEHGYTLKQIEKFFYDEILRYDFYKNSILDICKEYNIKYYFEEPWFLDLPKITTHTYGFARDLQPADISKSLDILDSDLIFNEHVHSPENFQQNFYKKFISHPSPIFHKKVGEHMYNNFLRQS